MDWKELGKKGANIGKKAIETTNETITKYNKDKAEKSKIKYQEQTQADKDANKAGIFEKGVYCPKCRSKNVEFMQNNRKGFSAGKAVTGAALTGGIGTLAGFAGKKGKNEWHCTNCGNVFKKK